MTWKLPPSPGSKLYREMLLEIDYEHGKDPLKAMAMLRAVAETDLWAFIKFCTSLGLYRIGERAHPRRGGLWVDEPDFFEMIRAAQHVIEEKIDPALFYVHRFGLKSSGIVKSGILWILGRDTQETCSIHTHKVDQVGEGFGGDILHEIQNSEVLQSHWPQFRQLQEASDTRITVGRASGPREPSVSVHSILSSAASMHVTRIFVDDPVSDKIVESVVDCETVDRNLKNLVPLRSDDTPMLFVGMPFGKRDPVYQRYRDGFFKFVYFAADFKPDGTPHLHSAEFFKKQEREIKDSYLYSCHYKLNPTERKDRYFLDAWKRYYRGRPEPAAAGSHIHLILDPAGGSGSNQSDYTCLRVVAMTPDRKRRNLDLWRERIGLTDTLDLIFGARDASPAWVPKSGVAKRWLSIDRHLILWVEDFGNSAWYQAVRDEQNRRLRAGDNDARFTVRKLPAVGNRSKPSRIRFLQSYYRDGEIEYPEAGFGHGSVDDERDTMVQYFEEEYSQWVFNPESHKGEGVLHDDALDTEAWHVQPEMIRLMPYPERPVYGGPEDEDFFGVPGAVTTTSIPHNRISWRAW